MGPSSVSTFTNSRGTKWYLHTKEVVLRNGHEQRIYWFAREENTAFSCEMPDGYAVMETKRTGMPVLKRV